MTSKNQQIVMNHLRDLNAKYVKGVGWYFTVNAGVVIPEKSGNDPLVLKNSLINELDQAKMMLNKRFDEVMEKIRES